MSKTVPAFERVGITTPANVADAKNEGNPSPTGLATRNHTIHPGCPVVILHGAFTGCLGIVLDSGANLAPRYERPADQSRAATVDWIVHVMHAPCLRMDGDRVIVTNHFGYQTHHLRPLGGYCVAERATEVEVSA